MQLESAFNRPFLPKELEAFRKQATHFGQDHLRDVDESRGIGIVNEKIRLVWNKDGKRITVYRIAVNRIGTCRCSGIDANAPRSGLRTGKPSKNHGKRRPASQS